MSDFGSWSFEPLVTVPAIRWPGITARQVEQTEWHTTTRDRRCHQTKAGELVGSDIAHGAVFTAVFPVALLAAVVLWAFFERRPPSRWVTWGSKRSPEPVGSIEIEAVEVRVEMTSSGPETGIG